MTRADYTAFPASDVSRWLNDEIEMRRNIVHGTIKLLTAAKAVLDEPSSDLAKLEALIELEEAVKETEHGPATQMVVSDAMVERAWQAATADFNGKIDKTAMRVALEAVLS